MRFAWLKHRDSKARQQLVWSPDSEGDRWFDFSEISLQGLAVPLTPHELLDQWDPVFSSLRQLRSFPSRSMSIQGSPLSFDSPVGIPVSLRDAYAFRQHVETSRRNRGLEMIPEFDQFPVFYFGNRLSVQGEGEVLVHQAASDQLDYELEVAIVVKKKLRDASIAQADDAIAGLMIMNDWSARRLQMEEMKLNLGPAKGKDFATALGPFLVPVESLTERCTQSERGRRWDLKMTARVNGALLSVGNLKEMNWTFAEILARVSQGVTLYPGEVIGSGTVGTGCLLELNGSGVTHGLWLKDGDRVELEVDQLGILTNTVRVDTLR